jgi:hypothetical protein
MYRIQRQRRRWRNRWPFRKWLPAKLDERFCRVCWLPYLNGPLPNEIKQFFAGNVAALLFPAGAVFQRGSGTAQAVRCE